MKKLYYSFLLSLIIVFVNYKVAAQKDMSDVLGAGAEVLIGELRGTVPAGLESFERYNQKNYKQINTDLIVEFLNKQIKELGLSSTSFRYFVGDEWKVVSLAGGKYGLVIPNALPSMIDTVKMVTGAAYEPANKLNIVDLDEQIKSNFKNKNLYNQYRLAMRKALIEAVNKKMFGNGIYLSVVTGLASAQKLAEQLGSNAQYVITALSTLYPYAVGQQNWANLQRSIDENVLKSNDIGLIEARIADLEQQVNDEKSSYLSKAYDYLPAALRSGEKSALEQRLELLKNYLDDGRFELEMYQKFLDKQRQGK